MKQKNVLEYLEKTVRRLPDKTAYADEETVLSFSQVYGQSRAVGSTLLEKGFYNEPVVVFMPKSPKTIAAFFGCVYGGCYYVPIDPEMPRSRIELIFKNLDPRAIICDSRLIDELATYEHNAELMLYDELIKNEINEKALADVRDRQIDTDPIYIVFTSGSTGVPKGVVACHRSVIDYIEQLSEVLGFSEQTVFANQSPLYFDACLKELYPTIKFGATAYLTPQNLFMFPVKLVEYLNEHKVNTICWVVSALTMISAFNTFKTIKPQYLHTIAFGSEVFAIKQFNRWREALPDATFTNLYGPTETTGMCCYYRVDREFEQGDVIPIGRPFQNREVILLTDEGKRAEQGEVGEICIRGTALTLGYYCNPQKTAEVFVQNPLNSRYPELIYRTGDLGRLNEYGELVFVSRKDFQIKHMGHRIELGEIEVNVNTLPGISMCCCLFDRQKDHIWLYYVGEISESELTGELKEKLPRYMLPNRIKKLDALPFTANGKIDRVSLQKRLEEK
ncbi:MAG: amino acid adenylation domain-containing protein [Ruminococcus sp.]|nr:amino acid adenylation domain-containing protein [Ruminococcus sp.]MBR1393936.1 amino acid adenylation domain-containing protein [Ruminococcus sp.]